MNFKTMDDELLIECVRVHEEIYSPDHKHYNDFYHRDNVWKSIAAQLNKSASNCKTRWIYIRDQYRKSINKRKLHGNNKAYKYDENLQFLIPFFKERDKKRAEKWDIQESSQFELVLDDISINQIETLEGNSAEFEDEEQIRNPKRRKRTIEATSTIPNVDIIKVKSDDDLEEISDPLELVNNTSNIEVPLNKSSSTTHIDAFFAAMAATVKTFSPYNQVIAKSKIFSVISGLEMKQIQQEAGESVNDENDSN